MPKTSQKAASSLISAKASEIKPSISSAEIKAEVVMALSHLDTLYRENIYVYAEKLHDYTRMIDHTKQHLQELSQKKEPYDLALTETQKELDHTMRLLERLTEEWNEKTAVIRELEHELIQLNHTQQQRENILKEREKSLILLENEIEDLELLLLEHELQKQNILLEMEPLEREINQLKRSIGELEAEKHYIESSYLHQLSPSLEKPNLSS